MKRRWREAERERERERERGGGGGGGVISRSSACALGEIHERASLAYYQAGRQAHKRTGEPSREMREQERRRVVRGKRERERKTARSGDVATALWLSSPASSFLYTPLRSLSPAPSARPAADALVRESPSMSSLASPPPLPPPPPPPLPPPPQPPRPARGVAAGFVLRSRSPSFYIYIPLLYLLSFLCVSQTRFSLPSPTADNSFSPFTFLPPCSRTHARSLSLCCRFYTWVLRRRRVAAVAAAETELDANSSTWMKYPSTSLYTDLPHFQD